MSIEQSLRAMCRMLEQPGIPPDYPDPAELVSDGCIQPPELI